MITDGFIAHTLEQSENDRRPSERDRMRERGRESEWASDRKTNIEHIIIQNRTNDFPQNYECVILCSVETCLDNLFFFRIFQLIWTTIIDVRLT